MPKAFQPQIVSANDLFVGDVVYLTQAHDWTRDITEAAVAETPERAETLLDTALGQANQVIGPYLVTVTPGTRPRPTHFRERARDLGPSNRSDLGRQADRVAL